MGRQLSLYHFTLLLRSEKQLYLHNPIYKYLHHFRSHSVRTAESPGGINSPAGKLSTVDISRDISYCINCNCHSISIVFIVYLLYA